MDLQSTVFCCTASMGLLLAEAVHKRGLAEKINLKKVIYGSERSSRSMRKRISELLGGAELFDIPGLTELYGPGTGSSARTTIASTTGATTISSRSRPGHPAPLPDGEWGEMGVTTLAKEAAPSFATGPATLPGSSRAPARAVHPAAAFEDQGAHRRRVQIPRVNITPPPSTRSSPPSPASARIPDPSDPRRAGARSHAPGRGARGRRRADAERRASAGDRPHDQTQSHRDSRRGGGRLRVAPRSERKTSGCSIRGSKIRSSSRPLKGAHLRRWPARALLAAYLEYASVALRVPP